MASHAPGSGSSGSPIIGELRFTMLHLKRKSSRSRLRFIAFPAALLIVGAILFSTAYDRMLDVDDFIADTPPDPVLDSGPQPQLSFDIGETPQLTLHLSSTPEFDSHGFWTESPILVSMEPPGARDIFNHTYPHVGSTMHLASGVHPSKGINAKGYVLESLWWMEDATSWPEGWIQGVTPDFRSELSFECVFGEEVVEGQMISQGRDEYFLINCPIPHWIAPSSYSAKAVQTMFTRIRDNGVQLRMWSPTYLYQETEFAQEPPPKVPHRDVALADGSKTTQALVLTHRIPRWSTPKRTTAASICTAPIYFDKEMTTTDVLEWRLWHEFQGIDTVHWYARDDAFCDWVSRLNDAQNLYDTCKVVPVFTPFCPVKNIYADQSHWQHDCILRYSHVDDWQIHIDIDEYLFATNNASADAVLDRIKGYPANLAAGKFYQTYYGVERVSQAPEVANFDRFPRNAWARWTWTYFLGGIEQGARYVKGVYRTAGIETVWVHDAISTAPGYYAAMPDDLDNGSDGLLQILHSRKTEYEGLTYDADNQWQLWTETWETLAERLKSLPEFYNLYPSNQTGNV